MDQLRLMNRHCLLTSYIGYEGYSTSSGPPQRVMNVVLLQAKKRGLLHADPRKADTIMLPMEDAIEAVERTRERLGVVFSTKADKRQAIVDILDTILESRVHDVARVSAKKKPSKQAWL